MDKLNELTDLYDIEWACRAAKVLEVASKIGMFTLLAQKRLSATQICQRLKTNPAMTEKLLIASAALGLVKKHGSQYQNSQLAKTYLVQGQPLHQGDMIAHADFVWNFWGNLPETIFSGPKQHNMTEAEHETFIRAMHNIAIAGRSQLFLDNVDLSGRRKLFDVGGGPGTYSILACRRYPELKAVVFDLPEIISITKDIIAGENMQDRVTVLEGNWQTDSFGENNDVVLLSDVMHGPENQAEMKLKKAYDSMPAGGVVVIQEFLLNNEKTGPVIPAIFNVMVGAYSEKELLSLLRTAGFHKPRITVKSKSLGSTWITAVK